MLARFWMILIVVMVLTTPVVGDEIKIASWNIENFGQTKAGLENGKHEENNTIGRIAEIIKIEKIDLIAIQEYTDHGVEKAVKNKLLTKFSDDWAGIASSNTGCEKYLIVYNTKTVKPVQKHSKIRIYDDWNITMERLPGYCSFEAIDGSFDFTIITCHNRTWEKGAEEEAKLLDNVYEGVQDELSTDDNDIILLGDFNIKNQHKVHFTELIGKGFEETIDFKADTMVSKSNESNLDNIFYPTDQDLTLIGSGVIRSVFIDETVSDHYPVWATFKILQDDDQEKEAE